MSIRFQGCISVDVADYDGDVEVTVDDAADISELMEQNNITIEEVMEYHDINQFTYGSVVNWLADEAEPGELFNIIDICARELRLLLTDEMASRQLLLKEVNDLKLSKSELIKAIKQFDSSFPDDV
jgi:hypothetical protein